MAEREGKGSSGVDEAGNAYAVFDNQWITYDTPNTVLEKVYKILFLLYILINSHAYKYSLLYFDR